MGEVRGSVLLALNKQTSVSPTVARKGILTTSWSWERTWASDETPAPANVLMTVL